MITRRAIGYLAAVGAWLVSGPAARAICAEAKPETVAEFSSSLSVRCDGAEHELCGFHPRAGDRVRMHPLPIGDNIVSFTDRGQIVIAFRKGAATVTRTGKRIVIDLA